jgi:prevent-host-death family protein
VDRIGVRELRQHASRYLRRVKAGETLEVTERGKLIALLVPPEPAATARERLVESDRLIPRRQLFTVPQRLSVPDARPSTAAVLDDLRDEPLR